MSAAKAFLLIFCLLSACGPLQAPTSMAGPTDPIIRGATVVPSPTPTTAELIYPYTLEGLRHHNYQGGVIKIVSTLEQTPVYTRYLISYPSDGLTITAIMQIPAHGHAPFPVIVMNHGYFDREGYVPGDGTWRAAEYLNQHGYLTLASDYRSWGGSEVGPSLFYTGLAIDVINLINAIQSIPEADPSRVGIWGHSMGGGVTMKVIAIDARVKAAVLYSPVSADDADVIGRWGIGCVGDIHAGELQADCNSSDILPLTLPSDLIRAYKDASTDPDLLRQISPIYHLDFVTAPVEISYGTNDGKVLSGTPPDWSKKLYQALKDAGKDAQLFAYDGEYHSFNGDAWIAFMDRTTQFFDEHVKNSLP